MRSTAADRHDTMSMNVGNQTSKYMIWKCITIPRRAAKGMKKKAKGSQKETKWEPQGVPKGDQTEPKGCQHLKKHVLRNRSVTYVKKDANMGCQNDANNDAQSQ